MYSYKRLFVSISAAILLICVFSGFSNSTDEVQLKRLLDLRTEILQQTYYKELSLEEAVRKLGQIETQPLLGEDVEMLTSSEPCQLDIVQRMEFAAFEKGTGLVPYSTYKISVIWYMQGMEGEYISNETYHVVVKTVNQTAKISKFDPIEII